MVWLSSGAISTKIWSLFYGLTGAEAQDQMGGSIFFGGYDRAKIQGKNVGKNVTFPISRETSCRTGLVATVISVDVKFENGTTQNIHASLIRMCLDPTFAIVSCRTVLSKNSRVRLVVIIKVYLWGGL